MVKRRDRRQRCRAQYQNSFQISLASGVNAPMRERVGAQRQAAWWSCTGHCILSRQLREGGGNRVLCYAILPGIIMAQRSKPTTCIHQAQPCGCARTVYSHASEYSWQHTAHRETCITSSGCWTPFALGAYPSHAHPVGACTQTRVYIHSPYPDHRRSSFTMT